MASLATVVCASAAWLHCSASHATGSSAEPATTPSSSPSPAPTSGSAAPASADADTGGDVHVGPSSVLGHLTVQGVEIWLVGSTHDALGFVRVQYRAPQFDPSSGRIVAPLPSQPCDRNALHSVAPDVYEFARSVAESDHQFFNVPLEYLEAALARSHDNAPMCLTPVFVTLSAPQVATVQRFVQTYREALGTHAPPRMLPDREPLPPDVAASGYVSRYSNSNGTGHHFVRAMFGGGAATWTLVWRIPVSGAPETDVRLVVQSNEPPGRHCDESLHVTVDGHHESLRFGSAESDGPRVERGYGLARASVERWPHANRVALQSCGHAVDLNDAQKATVRRFFDAGNEIVAALASHRL